MSIIIDEDELKEFEEEKNKGKAFAHIEENLNNVQTLDVNQLRQLKKEFALMDEDGDGTISREELTKMLKNFHAEFDDD